jgi:DNA polymerase III alpha subunit
MSRYFEFAVASNFSFLRGASHAEELMLQAAHIGLDGIGLCDRNSVAGVVRAHLIKREQKLALKYHPGARLVFADGTPDILAYPRDRAAWGRLCRLLTCGNLRAEKGDCILLLDDLLEHIDGLELIVMEAPTRDREAPPPEKWKTPPAAEVVLPQAVAGKAKLRLVAGSKKPPFLAALQNAAPGRVRLAATMLYRGNDRARLARRAESARAAGVPLIAVNDVFYHLPDRRELQDVLTCIREHLTIDKAGRRLAVNAERFLKTPDEMARLFRAAPDAIDETLALDAALTFSLDELRYEYPDEARAGFATPQEALVHLTWEGAATRYPGGIPDNVRQNLEHELALIAELQYAPYFLTVHDIIRYARTQDILCQGRGSAANSSVCYCLGVTEVDPSLHDLLFERFVSADRNEPPDIDVDFEHERREEVIQYIYRRYGRERTGIAATVISYRGRSAIREVGKVFGLSEDTIGALSSSIWGMGGGAVRTDTLVRAGIDVNSPRMRKMRALVDEIQSFPRHLSQHVGGFVITRNRLDEAIPIANAAMEERTFVEWDKDDLDALGMLKVDVLGLGMLTCIRKAFEFVDKHYGKKLTLATIPQKDKAVYRMLQRADSLGVFQVESRAQMSMLPRLKPENFYDLVIEVAIVRPGPIQGDMVHPYLRRRQGLEKVEYVSPELEAVLKKTLGVPLFQEQAMKIAIVAGGFTPGEADKLRRAMATFKRTGTIGTFKTKMIEGMVERKYPREFAERCFSQIEGFGEYGFPESHAASFALLVYASAWLKCRYPDVFAAALLNAQPMGFYAPAQIVRDVREHGVEVRAVDVNHSDWDATLEPGPPAALATPDLIRGSGQRGHSISARAGHSPEPGSSARAALASEASGQRGYSMSARAGHSPEPGSSARVASANARSRARARPGRSPAHPRSGAPAVP